MSEELEFIEDSLLREGFILNSFTDKERVFQKDNIQLTLTDLS